MNVSVFFNDNYVSSFQSFVHTFIIKDFTKIQFTVFHLVGPHLDYPD